MKVARKRLGLIVNPVAGLGGRVGLHGSDGVEIQRRALALGAVPQAHARTVQALGALEPLRDALEVYTYPGEMGASAALASGFAPIVVGEIEAGHTTAEDTRRAAVELRTRGVDLLLFAGGDGTARDVYDAVGTEVVALGIPAGVKIHSAVFALNPRRAGELAADYLQGRVSDTFEAEVMDIDEEAHRSGVLAARLYGYLRLPRAPRLTSGGKAPSAPGEQARLRAIANQVVSWMKDGVLYIVGPGTTTRAIFETLGLPKTLLGVDAVLDRALVAADASEAQLLALLDGRPAQIIVTPIGGQGYLLGRGNQPISPAVLRRVGKSNLLVVATPDKLSALHGRPLLVDTGDAAMDDALCGYVQVVTGYGERAVYRIST